MRLLNFQNDGTIGFTDDLIKDIPQYAILSHTWGPNKSEVIYEDMTQCTGRDKEGYRKIDFCRKQAACDGLEYFWVDTCCIDKRNITELTEAINSMFRWYNESAKCYVYLTDVSVDAAQAGITDRSTWESSFRNSRWFTRGWTLQELIAPNQVEFYSKEGVYLGDKKSLEQMISEITDIPVKVLRGSPLSLCTVAERFAWAEKRQTTKPEDKAYSLLGIFDVQLALLYGEGEEKALGRVREETLKSLKGFHHEDFSVAFSLFGVPEIERFVAREQEVTEIHQTLRSNGSRRVVVLHGLGGIGKTQLAISYAKQFKDKYSAVFWLNIKDEDAVKQSFANTAKQILREHPSAPYISDLEPEDDVDQIIIAVKAWLSLPNNTRWLLIYDNYDNPLLPDNNTDVAAVDIGKYLPDTDQGSVVITTRSSQVKLGHTMRLRKIENIDDCVAILLATSKREDSINDPDAVNLAKELDGLPLALATAGAYLEQTATSFSSYLRLYKESWARLQESSPKLKSYDDRILYSTWQLSFDRVREKNENSANLLRLWGYFDSQDLWLQLLQHTEPKDPRWVAEVAKDELSFNETIRTLSEYGLVEISSSVPGLTESRGYSVHSCIHSWIIHVLNQDWEEDLARVAMRCVALHVPKRAQREWWITGRRLLQHAVRCTRSKMDTTADEKMTWCCHRIGTLFKNEGKLDEAEKLYLRALEGYEKIHGPDHITTYLVYFNLGNTYRGQRKTQKSEEMFQRAMQGLEKGFGSNNPSSLNTTGDLDNRNEAQHEVDNRKDMVQRIFKGYERELGPHHTSKLSLVDGAGSMFVDRGQFEQAEKMYKRAMQERTEVFGPEHEATLRSLTDLAFLYRIQGRLKEAKEFGLRAVRGCEKTLGPNHLFALQALNELGCIYLNLGENKKGEEALLRSMHGQEKVFGPGHTITLETVKRLGRFFYTQSRYEDAEAMYQRVLTNFEKIHGPEHRDTGDVIHVLGIMYLQQCWFKEAEESFSRSSEIFEKRLGPDHEVTLDAVFKLFLTYKKGRKVKEADALYKVVMASYEKYCASNRDESPDIFFNLGYLLEHKGSFKEAEAIYIRARQGYEKKFGPNYSRCHTLKGLEKRCVSRASPPATLGQDLRESISQLSRFFGIKSRND
ncbi:hypothetical protein GGS21DRAFT_339699 [Xylaria nigripes]|nr:hypothetical protein GGS21DRAFT_339699 [Xylaria nigripes]